MKKASYVFICPACKNKTGIDGFLMPRLFEPTRLSYSCGECQCDINVTLTKPQRSKQAEYDPMRMSISSVVARESDYQKQVREEEQRFNSSDNANP